MSLHRLFPHLRGFRLNAIRSETQHTIMEWECQRRSALCPSCHQRTTHIHSRYMRTVCDMPIHLTPVKLRLLVRKFFCRNPACARKIFTERLPELAQPHAQQTVALQHWLRSVGVTVGGEAGARLVRHQGIGMTGRTLLRMVHQLPLPLYPAPRVIGVDDWAWKRRTQYGAIVVDLERSCVIALLPDRSVPTVAAWLKQHPTIEIVARDRSPEFAAAITQALPHAQHVADRFHMMQNLTEYVDHLVTRQWKGLLQPVPHRFPRSEVRAEVLRHRQQVGEDRYQQVLAYRTQGWSAQQIAQQLGLAPRTVSRWLQQERGPGTVLRRRKPSHLDPFIPYLHRQWKRGERNAPSLWEKIHARGYSGSVRSVYRFLESFAAEAPHPYTPHPLTAISARRVTGWLLQNRQALSPGEQHQLDQILLLDPVLADAYQLIERFRRMIHERSGTGFEIWLTQVHQADIPELRRFAEGLERDKAVVKAGLILPYSTGPVEGHIHRLKLLKRQSYGRAGLALLARRMMVAV